MTQVSVCVRTHDRPLELRRALTSVLAQTFDDFEVVVSDDVGSAEAVVRELDDPRLRYVRSAPGAGMTANLRTALAHASGRLIALLDDDDRWKPDFLRRVAGAFAGDPGLGVVFSDTELVADGRRQRWRAALAEGRHDAFLIPLLERMPVTTSAAVMRREVWLSGEEVLPLADDMLGATTIWLRAAMTGWPFYYLDDPLVEYRVHGGQSVRGAAMAAAEIRTWESVSFTDPVAERLRRRRLARAQVLHSWHFATRAASELGAARRSAGASLGALCLRLVLERWAVRYPLLMRILTDARHPVTAVVGALSNGRPQPADVGRRHDGSGSAIARARTSAFIINPTDAEVPPC